MKRPRVSSGGEEEEEVPTAIENGAAQTQVWNNCPLVHCNIASYLHRFTDYIHLALSTKRLWLYFCENDETIQCYREFGVSPRARRFYTSKQRRNHLIECAIPRCIDFFWQRECRFHSKSDLAEQILLTTAPRGALGIFRRYAAFVVPEKQNFIFRHLISQMTSSGQDKAVCLLYTQKSYWLPQWQFNQSHFRGLFSAAAAHALRVPNFYALIYQQCLEVLQTTDPNANKKLQGASLIAAMGAETFEPQVVRHFWRPELAASVFYDCCVAVGREAGFEAIDSVYYERAATRLAWVARNFMGEPNTLTTSGPHNEGTMMTWNFAADEISKIAPFSFSIVRVRYDRAREEGEIRIEFQTALMHMRLHAHVPWQYSGFDAEGLGSNA